MFKVPFAYISVVAVYYKTRSCRPCGMRRRVSDCMAQTSVNVRVSWMAPGRYHECQCVGGLGSSLGKTRSWRVETRQQHSVFRACSSPVRVAFLLCPIPARLLRVRYRLYVLCFTLPCGVDLYSSWLQGEVWLERFPAATLCPHGPTQASAPDLFADSLPSLLPLSNKQSTCALPPPRYHPRKQHYLPKVAHHSRLTLKPKHAHSSQLA